MSRQSPGCSVLAGPPGGLLVPYNLVLVPALVKTNSRELR
jgi:hypothetical protein